MVFKIEDGVVFRSLHKEDIIILQKLVLHPINLDLQFYVYPTIVAEVDGAIAGFTQFTLTPDGILHSMGLRIADGFQGRGIGPKLLQVKERLAKEMGARMHLYAVAREEEVLQKILVKNGMHRCHDYPEFIVYAKRLGNA